MMSQIQCTIIEVKGWQQEDWPKSPAKEAIKTAEKCPIKNYPLLLNWHIIIIIVTYYYYYELLYDTQSSQITLF